jgi:hypothetical protein
MLSTVRTTARNITLGSAVALVTLFYPVLSYADATGSAATSASPSQVQSDTTGPQQPTGADASTFHYNSATGKWENDHYIWDPVTHQTTPKDQPAYTYNPDSKTWDTSTWHYDAASQTYKKVTTPAPQPLTTVPKTTQKNPSSAAASGAQTPTTSGDTAATATAVTNSVVSTAVSGSATVANNTVGGNAASGNATVTTNTINLLQSNTNLGSGAATFTTDINGNVNHNILVDPALLAMLQPASNNSSLPNSNAGNATSATAINNNINLAAATGDATVAENTTAGNAVTGNANAVANVVNVAGSDISAPKYFIGTINVYGNLNGNILLPADTLQSLISSNASDASNKNTGNLTVNSAGSQTIVNNVVVAANTGNATVIGNTSAGNATTGNGNTNVTLMNLTGHKIIGADSLLVFVNVLGKWMGLIMNAPNGATAAALGGGISSDASTSNSNSASSNTTTAMTIDNNINATAKSGDATVAHNTNAGNARTGNATASANILNLTNDQLALGNWFGILFINVFGNWNGSLGVNTAPAGVASSQSSGSNTLPSDTTTIGQSSPNTRTGGVNNILHQTYVLASQASGANGNDSEPNSNDLKALTNHQAVLGTSTVRTVVPNLHTGNASWQFAAAGLGLSLFLIVVERTLERRKVKVSE